MVYAFKAVKMGAKSTTYTVLHIVLFGTFLLRQVKATCFDVEGFIAAAYTPVYDNGSLALEYVRQYAQFLSGNGINGVVVASTTGEGPSLSVSDTKELLNAWVEAAKPLNLYVIAGVGNVLPDAQELASYAEELNVDAILARPEPYYVPESLEELLYNMQLIADAAPNTPLIYDDNPQYNDVYVDIEEFFDLATEKIPSFRGIKSNVFENLVTLRYKVKGEQKIYAANVLYLASEAYVGFKNYMMDVLSLFPKQVIEIVETAQGGEEDSIEKTRSLYNTLLDVYEAITEDRQKGNKIAAMKEAVPLLTGIDVGPVLPPIVPLTEDEKDALKKRLEAKNQTIIDSNA